METKFEKSVAKQPVITGLNNEQIQLLLEEVNRLIAGNTSEIKFKKNTPQVENLVRSLMQDENGNYFIMGDRANDLVGIGSYSEVRTVCSDNYFCV